jgi:preprotein translocase subunit SecG
MGTLLTVLTIIVCVLLIVVVLIQNSKGGGLATGGSGSQIMGVQKTSDFLEKATWSLAIALIVLAMFSKMGTGTSQGPVQEESELKEKIENTPVAPVQNQPSAPAPGGNAVPAPAAAPASTPAAPAN